MTKVPFEDVDYLEYLFSSKKILMKMKLQLPDLFIWIFYWEWSETYLMKFIKNVIDILLWLII